MKMQSKSSSSSHHHQATSSIVPSSSSSSSVAASSSLLLASSSGSSLGSSPSYVLQRVDDNSCFHNLGNFYLSGMFTDLTLNCNGTHFRCHRVILASVSMYIKQKLLNPEDAHHACCQHCLTVNQVPQEVMQSILNCIYHGKTSISERLLKPVSEGLSFLRIRGLNIAVKPRIRADDREDQDNQLLPSGGGGQNSTTTFGIFNPEVQLKIEDDDEDDLMDGPEGGEEEEDDDEEEEGEDSESYQTSSASGKRQSSALSSSSGAQILPPGALEPFTTMLVDGKEKPIYRCHLCGQIKSSKYILQRHIQYFHKTVKDIACRLCDSKVKYPSCLKRHVQNIHQISMADYNRLVAHIRQQFESQPNQAALVQMVHNLSSSNSKGSKN